MGTTPTFTLQLFSEPETAALEQRVPAATVGPQAERDRAEWLACQETWRPHPSRRPTSDHEPYSLPWYEEIERRRYSRHGHWIPKFFEFNRHRGDQVLCLGDGLGTDWVQFALNGANVHYCAPALEPLTAVRRHFELRGLDGNFHRGPYHELPFASDSKDVVCLSAMSKPLQPLGAGDRRDLSRLEAGREAAGRAPGEVQRRLLEIVLVPLAPAVRQPPGR